MSKGEIVLIASGCVVGLCAAAVIIYNSYQLAIMG